MKKYYDKKNKRLVFIKEEASSKYWDRQWKYKNFKKEVKRKSNDNLVYRITKKFLKPSKNIKILEGGCGDGHFVFSLDRNGYSVYGIDYAKTTVKKINQFFPNLLIKIGDVRNIDFSDNYFDAYWSLGVIEHFYNGYDEIIEEMKRVIKNNGYLFITFPQMSLLRKIKAFLNLYKKYNLKFSHDNFYQFALDYKEVKKRIELLDFKLIYNISINGRKGLKDEVNLLKPLILKINLSKNIFIRIIRKIISIISDPICGHSRLLVFINKK